MHGWTRTLLVTSALSLTASAQPAPDIQITLERTSCFGACPVYTVRIDGTGHVVYEGRAFVRISGRAERNIDRNAVKALADEFERLGFFSLDDDYQTVLMPNGKRVSMTDLPTTITTLRIGSRTKRVKDYLGAPEALQALEGRVDAVAGTMRWISVTPDVIVELRATGWRASGSEGAAFLIEAVRRRDAATIDALIRAGASPNGNGYPPLASAYDAAIIGQLVAAGADINVSMDGGRTILMRKVETGRADLVAAAVKAGARIDAKDRDGRTALSLAEIMAAEPPPPPIPGETAPREFDQIIAILRAAGAK